MVGSSRVFTVVAAALLFGVSIDAQRNDSSSENHWPYWRGQAQNGVAQGDAPTEWSDTRNIAWKVEIPGRGHSSPIVWGNRIFVTTAVPTGRTAQPPAGEQGGRFGRGGRGFGGGSGGGSGASQEHSFEVFAVDRTAGKVVWRQVATTAVPHEGYHQQYGSFASNSPVTDGQRVYAFFGSRGIYVYDMDGKQVWQKDFGLQMRMFNQFGEGAGPVLDDGRLILLFDHEAEGFITMLDAATGREVWRTARTEGTNWAAPLVVTHAGRKQIVVNSQRKVRGYDYETGKPLWEAAGLGQNTIPRPVQYQDLVLVMSGFRNPALMAIRLGREGDLTGTDAIVWSATRGLSYRRVARALRGQALFRHRHRHGVVSRRRDRRAHVPTGAASQAIQLQGVSGRCRRQAVLRDGRGRRGRDEDWTESRRHRHQYADGSVVHRVAGRSRWRHVPAKPHTPFPNHWSAQLIGAHRRLGDQDAHSSPVRTFADRSCIKGAG